MNPVLKAVLNIVLWGVSFLYSALLVQYGWNLFIAPLGVPTITAIHAVGIGCVVSLLTISASVALATLVNSLPSAPSYGVVWTATFIGKTLLLGLMYALSLFM